MEKKISGVECRFAIHIPSHHTDVPDVHLIKEVVHYDDGTTKPNLRFIKDFQRSFWITKKNKRSHTQKREWEHIDNLNEFRTTQSKLRDEVAKQLDKSWSKDRMRELSSSPYLYGTDISSTALIKKSYQEKYPGLSTPFSIATFDIETDVINDTKDPIIISSIFGNKAIIAVTEEYVTGLANPQEQFQSCLRKLLKDHIDKLDLKVELVVAKDTVEAIRAVFNRIHSWKPDFLAIWNMNFDIPQILDFLDKKKVNPKDIFCDPAVPHNLRICKYKKGMDSKLTSSGKFTPMNPSSQWHTLICTSSFYVIDAMCSYKRIRLAQPEESSYSLDAILTKELKITKLKIEEAKNYEGLKWHQFLQKNHKLEYMVYNIFDCLSMLELEYKTKDLAYKLPAFAATSDFIDFKSQPKLIGDAFYYFCKSKNHILGTVPPKAEMPEVELDEFGNEIVDESEEEEINEDVLSLKGWIVTLPAHLSVLGNRCLSDDTLTRTNIRAFVFDSDAVSAYPGCISTANVSKSTTKKELINIEGVAEEVFRMQNLNLVLGKVNSIEYATTMFGMPKPEELLSMFE